MLSRLIKQSSRGVSPYTIVRNVTTKTTITDYSNGKTIKLSDPNQPELGDYPNFKPVLAQSKDPYGKYDDQQHRRNLNDPMHIDEDLYDMWSPDYYQHVSDKTALKHNGIFFSCVLGFGALIWYFEANPEKPAMPRSYTAGGLARELGSGSEESDYFYRVKPDTEAEKELGFLSEDNDVQKNRDAYLKKNADFFKL